MTRSSGNVVICVCLAMGAVLLAGSAPRSHKDLARRLFSDPKVAELAAAAAEGDLQRVDALVAEGADVNARGQEGLTPLLYAMSGKDVKGFQRLLERGADPNKQMDDGESAMSIAAGSMAVGPGDSERLKVFLKMLLAHGGDPNLRVLPRAPRSANLRISWPTLIYHPPSHENARILIKAGADVDARNDSRDTPMIHAAGFERFDVVYALLAAGADFRLENLWGTTLGLRILDSALDPMSEAEKWRRKCMEFMEKRGVDFQREKLQDDELARQEEEWFRRAEEKEKEGEYPGFIGEFTSSSVARLVLADAEFPRRRFKYDAKDFFADPKVAELAQAAARGDVERVDALVAQGADVNARGEQGLTPLLYAMSGKGVKGFQRLLQLGADPNQHMDTGESAMKWAACQSGSQHLKALLAHGGNPDLRYPTADIHATPLHWAIRGPSVQNARILIKAGADPRARGANGSPLVCAADGNRFDMVYAMLEAGADFRPVDPDEYTLAQAILSSEVDPDSEGEKWKHKCIEFLSEKGVDLEKVKREVAECESMIGPWEAGPRPFSFSLGAVLATGDARARRNHPAKQLFADPKVAELAEAAARGDVERVDALIPKSVDVNARGKEGVTPLLYAMSERSIKGFQRLLERGADPNAKTDERESPMHWAAYLNESEHLKMLLRHGGDPNLRFEQIALPTPIFWAVSGPSAENVRILIKAGADVNMRDSTGHTALTCAIARPRYDMVYILLEAGADFWLEDRSDRTVIEWILHTAVDLRSEGAKWRQKCIAILEEKGVDLEKDKQKDLELSRRVDQIAREIEEDMRAVREKRKRTGRATQDPVMSVP